MKLDEVISPGTRSIKLCAQFEPSVVPLLVGLSRLLGCCRPTLRIIDRRRDEQTADTISYGGHPVVDVVEKIQEGEEDEWDDGVPEDD